MRLYQTGALLTGARSDLIPHAGVPVDGTRIVAAGPLGSLTAEHATPPDVADLGDLTVLPGLVDAHVHPGFDGGPAPVARMTAETDTEQLILMLRSARELLSAGVTTARDLGARSFLDIAVRAAIEHCSFAGPDRKYGSDFDPSVVENIAAAGIYVCPTMNVHALTKRELFGDALEKVIMGLYSGGAASDIMLGWIRVDGVDGVKRDFYLRQLWDAKGSALVDLMEPNLLAVYGRVCGKALARAHARAGDAVAIASYLGGGDTFDRALAEFAVAYADQNERDYDALRAAADSGRIKAETGI